MKPNLFKTKNMIAVAMILSTGVLSAQQWQTFGNGGITSANYVGTVDPNSLYFRVNGKSPNPGQALLNESGSFIVESVNNSNTVKTKGSIISGASNILGPNSNSSLVSGWENNLGNAGGANIVAGQQNRVTNNASKSVALGWNHDIRNHNQFAIGVGVDLTSEYSGGFGVDLIATGNRSFVFGSGSGGYGAGAKLTNTIPRSIMFGVTTTPTMLMIDQRVGVRTTAPSANFHTVGTVRLQDLPSGDGRALVVDNDGNVMVASSYLYKTAGSNEGNVKELQHQIDALKQELSELKELLLKKNDIRVDMTSNEAKLYQNAPNPSKGETTIRYYLPENSRNAMIEIYSLSGQLLKNVSLKEKGNGTINLTGLQANTYVYKMTVDGKTIDSKKMLIQN